MKLKELFEDKTTTGFYSYDNDDWVEFRSFANHIHAPGDSEVVFRSTTGGIEGQMKSKNYHATYFTPDMVYVQDYVEDGGYIGAFVLSHLDKFVDLRYAEQIEDEFDLDDEGEDQAESAFAKSQEKKLAELAKEYYKKEPTLQDVYDMLENPQPKFIKLLRDKGYYGMLTSEGMRSSPVYAVFNEHLKDCIKHVPFTPH